MKPIRLCLTLAAFILTLPALAEDKPASPYTGHTELNPPITGQFTLTGPADPELLLMQIDLKVLLQHYEKLRTEVSETKLQLELGGAGVGTTDPLVEDTRKALADIEAKEKSTSVSKEEIDAARMRYDECQKRALDNLQRRYQVLQEMAAKTREEARALAKELAARMQDYKSPPSR